MKLTFLAAAQNRHIHTAIGLLQRPADILRCGNVIAVDSADLVTDLQTRFSGDGHGIVKGCHRDHIII